MALLRVVLAVVVIYNRPTNYKLNLNHHQILITIASFLNNKYSACFLVLVSTLFEHLRTTK